MVDRYVDFFYPPELENEIEAFFIWKMSYSKIFENDKNSSILVHHISNSFKIIYFFGSNLAPFYGKGPIESWNNFFLVYKDRYF